jgi:hypothetical protein
MKNATDQSNLSCLKQIYSFSSQQRPCNDDWKLSPLFEGDTKFEALIKLRMDVYSNLGARKNASMDLIDSLACQETAQSVTDLSCQPQFVRQYPSVTDAIHHSSECLPAMKDVMLKWGADSLPSIQFSGENYVALGMDSTPAPHANAHCLADRTFIHDSSNSVTGNPINIGHTYSAVVGLTNDSAWVSPLLLDRVPSEEVPVQFGMNQAIKVCSQLKDKRAIFIGDSAYNNLPCRMIAKNASGTENDPIFILRSACNRKYYTPAVNAPNKSGRTRHYGERINVYKPNLGAKPDISVLITHISGSGTLAVFVWQKVYTKQKGGKGYEDPSSLIVIFEFRADSTPKYKRPLVLRVFIPKGCNFNPTEADWLYFLRFQIERLFSALKKRLLFGKFSSPDVLHQETFSTMCALAYQQWFFAKETGDFTYQIKPWHRYPKSNPKGAKSSPAHTQKGYSQILKTIGTPSTYQPPRNIPPGRPIGEVLEKRPHQPVIKKTKTETKPPAEKKSNAASMKSEEREQALKICAQISNENQNNKQTNTCPATIFLLAITLKYFFYFFCNFFANPPSASTCDIVAIDTFISSPFEKRFQISNGDKSIKWLTKQIETPRRRYDHGPPSQ